MHNHDSHGHSHDHDHSHSHNHEAGSDDLKKLNILLDHWVAHNKEHAAEFSGWSEKATAMGKEEVSKAIDEAVKCINKANEHLAAAKEKM